MTTGQAREWLIKASLIVCACLFTFVLIAPLFGYPLEVRHGVRLIQMVFPVLLGYLGSAAHFLFRPRLPVVRVPPGRQQLLKLLVQGPVVMFVLAASVCLIAFGVSNRATLADGSGMRVDELATLLSVTLGFLTVVTNVVVAYLFATDAAAAKEA
jgi:hypothetical protein